MRGREVEVYIDDMIVKTKTIYVDGSWCGAGVILENSDGLAIEYSLKFDFPTSNNQVEYEACLAGIWMAKS
jgi:ribonuclease HI